MSFGGPDPYQPSWPPGGGPYPPPPQPGPYVPPQPGPPPHHPYGPPPYGPYHPYGPYVPPPRTSLWRRLRDDEWPTLGELLRRARGRGNAGCAWALLTVPCFWGVTLPLLAGYPLARSARNRARRIFPAQGHRRIDDPEVRRVQKARAWTATVMSFLILTVYGTPGDMAEAQEQYLLRLAITPWLLLLSAPLVVALLYRWAAAHTRLEMRRRLRLAGRSALWYLGVVTSLPLAGLGAGAVVRFTDGVSGAGQVLVALLVFALFGVLVWAACFLLFATGSAVRGAFNTAEVHAALPALLTGFLVWEFTAISLATGGIPPGPPLVQICALLGGPASVTAVAWWEIRRLRTRYGVVLRSG
ncbi:hypothetical protein ACWC10_07725 [Streptomyces sp. NPDC001595]|uniref:hypothetical protein n=1 Tax=Streptomyces sp. NPDC001532 TaxID=3154520 RepID=UPI003325CA15